MSAWDALGHAFSLLLAGAAAAVAVAAWKSWTISRELRRARVAALADWMARHPVRDPKGAPGAAAWPSLRFR